MVTSNTNLPIMNNITKVQHFYCDYFQCNKCQQLFSSNLNLFLLNKLAHVEDLFNCSICDATFKTKQTLSSHLKYSKTHIQEKPLSCTICRLTFNKNEHLKSHIKNHVEKNGNIYKCGYESCQYILYVKLHCKIILEAIIMQECFHVSFVNLVFFTKMC